WFGGQSGSNIGNNTVRLEGTSTSGYKVYFHFCRGGNPANEIRLKRVEVPGFLQFRMQSKYKGEDTADVWQSQVFPGLTPPFVTYYNTTQTGALRVTVNNGQLYTSNGKLLDTSQADISHV